MTIKAVHNFGGVYMNTLFGIIMVFSFFAIPYYGIRRTLTKKSKPDVYLKIKKRIWYATAILVVSFIGVSATQSPTKATTKHSQSAKVTHPKKSEASKKLDDARLNVDGLFSDSKHTKLIKGISHKDIKSVSKDVDALKDSKAKDKLKKDVLKAEKLWVALKEKRKRESASASSKSASESREKAAESSKAEEAKKASESVAASESAAKASSESAQRVAESNSIAESNAAAQAAAESTRQASANAAAQAASAQAAAATNNADASINNTNADRWAIENGYTWENRKGHSHIIHPGASLPAGYYWQTGN